MFEHYLHRADMQRMYAHSCMNYAIFAKREGLPWSAKQHMRDARQHLRKAIEAIQAAKRFRKSLNARAA